jgi:hypothetical protein
VYQKLEAFSQKKFEQHYKKITFFIGAAEKKEKI